MRQWLPRALHIGGWAAAAVMLGLCLTQWFGVDDRRTVAALQALTPYVLVWSLPLGVAAALMKRPWLAISMAAPLLTLAVLAAPIVFHPDPADAAGAPTVSVAFANTLYSNPTPELAAAALAATDADVLVMAEFTPEMQTALAAAVGDAYPHRSESVMPRPSSNGIAVWSRLPIVSGGPVEVGGRTAVDVTVQVAGTVVRVLAVHTSPPTHDAAYWGRQLRAVRDRAARGDVRTLVVGDFNGSRWHPSFRALLDSGWTDTHEAMGRGWSVSWPTDEGWLPPTFVRLDHALFGKGLSPTTLRDLDVPGGYHRGFTATYAVMPVS
ncbi:MAG: endonuclease/exonuclease/phosphatase family protein [Actinomycetota bacterium]